MTVENRTTLSGITPEQLMRLQLMALELGTGKRSVSALIRHIAENGMIEKYPAAGGAIKNRLVVEQPAKEGKPDAQQET